MSTLTNIALKHNGIILPYLEYFDASFLKAKPHVYRFLGLLVFAMNQFYLRKVFSITH